MSAWRLGLAAWLAAASAALAQGAEGAAQTPPASSTAQPAPLADPTQTSHSEFSVRLEAANRHLSQEPSAARVVGAALAYFDAQHGDTRAVASRARRAGWVPRLTLGARRGQGLDYSSQQGSSDRLQHSTDDDLTLFATLTFELDRVVFRSEEVGLLRERRAARAARAARARAVLEVYYERRHALLETLLQGPSLERELAVAHTAAQLDAFTNGAFTRMIGSQAP